MSVLYWFLPIIGLCIRRLIASLQQQNVGEFMCNPAFAEGRKRKESNWVLHPTFDALTHAAYKISILDRTTPSMENIKLSPIDGCKSLHRRLITEHTSTHYRPTKCFAANMQNWSYSTAHMRQTVHAVWFWHEKYLSGRPQLYKFSSLGLYIGKTDKLNSFPLADGYNNRPTLVNYYRYDCVLWNSSSPSHPLHGNRPTRMTTSGRPHARTYTLHGE